MISKQLIIPMREWLLSQKRCAGCGCPLEKAETVNGKPLVCSACKRVYVFSTETGSYQQVINQEIN